MTTHTIVLTDLVDSTQLNQCIGDEAMAALWAQHDALARTLIRAHGGREVGRSDGFLVLFDTAVEALTFALAYHRSLTGLKEEPKARVGLHTGAVTLRHNRAEDTAQGAAPYELDGQGPCLLVLDNFEQVARRAEASVGRWLELAPQARFMVTTREVLGVPGEQVLAVPPLADVEAAQMFRQRSAAAQCGALDWSWELLSSAERAVLMQLAVFDGGFEIADAEAVIDPLTRGGTWVPDLLQALLEKSWLRPLGEQRLGMLRTVQDYAGEQLAAAGRLERVAEVAPPPPHDTPDAASHATRAEAEARHARHYAGLSEADATRGRGVELDNLVVACRRAALWSWPEAVPLLSRAWAVLRLTGPFQAAVELAGAVQQMIHLDDAQQAVVHRVLGAAHLLLGEVALARQHAQTASDGARAVADLATWGEAECLLAQLELSGGAQDAARQRLQTVNPTAAVFT